MLRFVSAALTVAALGCSLGAAQVGRSTTATLALPELSAAKRSGNVLTLSDGVNVQLTPRGNFVQAASVTLPTLDAEQAGVWLGALTGYGAGLATPYTALLKDPTAVAQLPTGFTIGAQEFQVSSKLSGKTFTFTVQVPEVPASAFAAVSTVRGPQRAPVVLRLFSDFQCPYCQQFEREAWPALQQALGDQLGSNVRYEFHQFPLERLHPNARAAAEASECAAAQGKFWAYHDALFAPSNWNIWTRAADPAPQFIALAQGAPLGSKLSLSRFKTCLTARGGKAVVDAGLREGAAVGVNGTPSLYVNGFKVANPYDTASVLTLIDFVRAQP